MAFYDDMAAVALELITEFGQSGTISDVTPGTYDPVGGGQSTPDTPITQTAQMILLDYTLQESGAKYNEGTQVLAGDKKILIAAQGLAWAPMMTSRVTADGAVWQAVNIKVSNPAGTPLVYEIHGRK
jgi:archaellin